jgi:hypothetical protein
MYLPENIEMPPDTTDRGNIDVLSTVIGLLDVVFSSTSKSRCCEENLDVVLIAFTIVDIGLRLVTTISVY